MVATQRIAVFDIAKALLILSMFIYHVPAIYIGWLHGTNETMNWLDSVNIKLINSFFMSAFFFISGYFLSHKSWLECIKTDALTILLPTVLLSLLNNGLYSLFWGNAAGRFHQFIELSYWTQISLGYWFLFALFINKQIVQVIVRCFKNYYAMFSVALGLCVLGMALKTNGIYNCCNSIEALMMCPMTLFGYYCRQEKVDMSRSHLRWYALGFVATLALLWVTDNRIAGFNLSANFPYDYIPMALWLGLSGTAFVLYVSSWMERFRCIAYMGTLTLPMFCLNFFFIEAFLRLFMPLFDRCGHALVYSSVVLICSVICSFAFLHF